MIFLIDYYMQLFIKQLYLLFINRYVPSIYVLSLISVILITHVYRYKIQSPLFFILPSSSSVFFLVIMCYLKIKCLNMIYALCSHIFDFINGIFVFILLYFFFANRSCYPETDLKILDPWKQMLSHRHPPPPPPHC